MRYFVFREVFFINPKPLPTPMKEKGDDYRKLNVQEFFI
jgi:hypothetical protein